MTGSFNGKDFVMSMSTVSRVSLTIDIPTAARMIITTKGHLILARFINVTPARAGAFPRIYRKIHMRMRSIAIV